MKLLITGGTGFVGTRLLKKLKESGHELVVLTRHPEKAKKSDNVGATFHRWDGISEDIPAEAFNGIEGVISLMGENIANKRWSDTQKKKLEDSRVKANLKLVEGIEKNCSSPLKVYIGSSAVGIYPTNSAEVLKENSGLGDSYLAGLCKKWEDAHNSIKNTERKVIMRTGVVFGPEAGALAKLLPIFKLGLGGPIGNGAMIMPWIHVDDLVKAIVVFVNESNYEGTYNLVAPNPCSNAVFTKALASAVKRPAIFPVPSFMLKLLMGEMSTIVLDSQNIHPEKLIQDGFKFDHPQVDEALKSMMSSS